MPVYETWTGQEWTNQDRRAQFGAAQLRKPASLKTPLSTIPALRTGETLLEEHWSELTGEFVLAHKR